MDLFTLKKIIGAAIMPLSASLLLLIIAILFFRAKPTLSFVTLLCATLLLLLSSFAPFSDTVMAPIEQKYPAFVKQKEELSYIIILGCGHTTDSSISVTSQLKTCSLQRLVEAVRIYQMHPEAQLITSGAAFGDPNSNAEMVKQAAIIMGIPEYKIVSEHFAKDTEEEALLISPRVKGSTTALVTNSDHMHRSVGYFKQHGVEVIPAPASHWVKGRELPKHWGYYVPSVNKLKQTTHAWYESVGTFVQWLKTL